MPKISIGYIQKNGSTFIGKTVLESSHVPRVGEIIRDTKMLTRGGNAFVLSVVHEVVDNELTVHIVAREWWEGHREAELANAGWLPTDGHQYRLHDEELMRFSDFNSQT